MPMYNLIVCSDIYSKTSGSLWHFYIDTAFINDDGAIADLPAGNNNRLLFKFKTKMAAKIGNDGKKILKLEHH